VNQTRDDVFVGTSGAQTVPFMNGSQPRGYARRGDYSAVSIPYAGNELSMTIVLPDDGKLSAVEQALNQSEIDALVADLRETEVQLSLPKFEYEAQLDLSQALSDLGMPDAFGNADFSGMNGDRELALSAVLHKAFINVNEAGTEAAAATAVIAGVTGAFSNPVAVKVDHPFLFFIRDHSTGAIVFFGRVAKI
jgi:serpin B